MTTQQRAQIDAMFRARPTDTSGTIEGARADFVALMDQMAVPGGITTREVHLADLRTVLVEPDTTPRAGTILYFHGGGNFAGSPETQLGLTAHLVSRTGIRAYSPEYRLAPEHPFPAGLEDNAAVYRALLDAGTDPSSIVFAGDSAGGGYTVTTALAARNAGLPLPAAIVAFSPNLDYTRSGASIKTRTDADPIFTRDSMAAVGELYLGGADPHQELLSPAVFADLTGFPPILLQVGGNEMLLDDSTRMASRAIQAGVDVILDVTAGVPHVFQANAGVLDEADQALDRAATFIRQHLA